MDCSAFITRFSDYYDRRTDDADTGEMEDHLASCPSCARYHSVVTKGGQLLRALPEPGVRQDFKPRLQHRIYHLEDEAAISRSAGSGTTGATALAMAVLLIAVAWTPFVRVAPEPTAEVPLVLDAPDPMGPAFAGPTSLFEDPLPRSTSRPLERRDLFVHTHSMLYEYSALSAKYRQNAELRRTGLQ